MADVLAALSAKEFFTPDFLRDPYSTYRRYLDGRGVQYLDIHGGVWAVFKHADCSSFLRDPRLSAKRTGTLIDEFPAEKQKEFVELTRTFSLWMLFFDAPEHTRLRKLIKDRDKSSAFPPTAVACQFPMGRSTPRLLRRRPLPNRYPDSGDQPPIHAKASPVPADNSFRSDDDDRLLPLRPQPTNGNPEELVKQIESRPRTTPFQHGQLLSQHKVLKDEIPAATEESKERPEREPEHAEHSPIYTRVLASGPLLCY